ncbi:MAG: UDP-N-acetylmuramate dehydrogenase [Parcubacteria group bacterium]|nr:UDP-N-acetylmuramate dehydrogenase [Parcubacteria group bacterium]
MVNFVQGVPLREHTSFRIGGPAKYFSEVSTFEELAVVLVECRRLGVPFFVLGGGTNVLASDEGYQGVVIKVKNSECRFNHDGSVHVGAGFPVPELVFMLAEKGFGGLEWAGGLPGTVGGAIRGNAGCFGGEMKDVVQEVESVRFESDDQHPVCAKRSNAECDFGYRASVFKKNGEIILSATLRLNPAADPQVLKARVAEKLAYRVARHPVEYPNAGSIFKNCDVRRVPVGARTLFSQAVKIDPFPVIPTAKIIAEAGLKGEREGGAEISSKHPNFIVNVNSAKANDVKALIRRVKDRVRGRFFIEIEEEVQFL